MRLKAAVHEKTEEFVHNHSEKKVAMYLVICAEFVMFASLIAVYFVMMNHQKNGPSPKEFIHFKSIILPTVFLLVSSLTCYLADKTLKVNEPQKALVFLSGTLLLAAVFLGFEIREFIMDGLRGHTLTKSPYLSSFFVLVGMHGSHVLFGIAWMAVLILHILMKGAAAVNKARIAAFSIYWHFVDAVWVFIFLLVYSLGELM
ncbi:cytochrome c oxidase subunit 3 [Peribacillus kribbensis]|uniref:cytochrome c oxidase subunit 3 n=1 Tax=Peribacillus kribbensis TaxID=356658 RepID=UPI0003FABD0C|nr:cytochrome c oxidase subunit 3 [Peribacillus kribbensis]